MGDAAGRARADQGVTSSRATRLFLAFRVSTTIVATPLKEWTAPPFHSTSTAPPPLLLISTMFVVGLLTVTASIEPDWTAAPLVLRM